MSYIQIIGVIAAVLTTSSFVPQAIQVIKTKETKGLSLSMYSMFFVGILLWLAYGILMMDLPLLIANSITIILAGVILGMKLKYK